MSSHLLSPNERLRDWKAFRKEVAGIADIKEQLLTVQEYWNKQAFVSRYIDIDSPEDWPRPWKLIYNGTYCPFAKVYLMEQTLILADDERYKPKKLRLAYAIDQSISDSFMILIYDNKYVLNYQYDQIINFDFIKKTCIIVQEYTESDQHRHQIKK